MHDLRNHVLKSVTADLHPFKQHLSEGLTPFQQWTLADGTVWTRFYRTTSGFLLRFPGLADFTVSPDGKAVVAYPARDVASQTVDHLYLNQVLPLALSRQFMLVLHASAVEIENFAVAFLGASGRGKSTLAASFSTSGFRFLTDDGLQMSEEEGGYIIKPSHPSIRLWGDSRAALIPESTKAAPPVAYTPKSRLLADDEVAHCDVARPLRCMYFLGESNTDTVSIAPISGRDAMIGLVKNCFLLDIEAREMLTHHFDQLSALAKTPMFFRLDYPRQYKMLPQVRETVVRHATEISDLSVSTT